MAQEVKVAICLIFAIWLFAMGVLVGGYRNRAPLAELENTSAVNTEPVGNTDNTQSTTENQGPVYVTDSSGVPVTDDEGVRLTEPSTAATSQATTVFATDSSGVHVTDNNGQLVTEVQTTEKPQSTVPGTQPSVPQSGQSDGKLIDGRFTTDAMTIKSNNFYVEGSQYSTSDNSTVPMKFATNGANSEIFTELSGAQVGMMILGDDMYVVYDGGYLKLTQSLMSTMGINLDDYNFDSTFLTSIFDDSAQATVEEGKLDGRRVTLTRFDSAKGRMIIYSDGNKLLQVEQYNKETDLLEGTIYFTTVTPDIPAGMLTVDGLQKKSFISFFTGLMNNAELTSE